MRCARLVPRISAALLTLCVVAACGGGSNGAPAQGPGAVRGRLSQRARRLTQRSCESQGASSSKLASVRTGFVGVSGPPFGIAATPDGRWSFVDLVGGRVALFSDAGFIPRLVRTITLPQDAVGSSLTPDGRYLLVADGADGATVVSVARAEAGASHAVLGTLRTGKHGTGGGAIEVISSSDGEYAFVSIEYGAGVAVYNLHAALGDGFTSTSYVGSVPLGEAVVGLALSPDGRELYATSELAAGRQHAGPGGTLSVISVRDAERNPARSVLANVPAKNSPVRVAVAPDGSVVWVTARGSNQLLAFSAKQLRADPGRALLASVRVGAAPVGLALFDAGRRLIVADSNRFAVPGARADLSVVDAAAALAHRPAVLGTVPAGCFPREMAPEPNGDTMLVSNFGSAQLEAVDLTTLR
jgi:DNA-binding beta-propeller fold protein YncE